MPATVSFIRLNNHTCVPIRVYVHRKEIILSSQVAINEKSLINLSSVSMIRLSNLDMTKLVEDIKHELKHLMFDSALRELFPKRSVLKKSQVLRVLGKAWKCRVVVSLGYLADLRYKMGYLDQADDILFLEEKKIDITPVDTSKVALLAKELKFSFHEPGEGEGEDKKAISYKLKRFSVVNSRVTDNLSVYVLHRPHH